MKLSVFTPVMPTRIEALLPFAGLAQWRGAARIWLGHNLSLDTHQVFAATAAAGFRVPMGAAVSLAPMAPPFTAALHARSVAVASGHPFVAGFGPGAPEVQHAVLGAPYARPLTAMREYVTAVRTLLAGEVLDTSGEYVRGHLRLPPLAAPPVEVGLGVLRRRMARLAGQVADVAITWLTPARYLAEVLLPELRRGAEEAGRPCPRLVAVLPACLSAPDRDPAEVALAGSEFHLRSAHYCAMLRAAGIPADPDHPEATAARLVAGGALLAGAAGELRARAAEFAAAGVDELVVNLAGVHARHGTRATLAELAELLDVLTR